MWKAELGVRRPVLVPGLWSPPRSVTSIHSSFPPSMPAASEPVRGELETQVRGPDASLILCITWGSFFLLQTSDASCKMVLAVPPSHLGKLVLMKQFRDAWHTPSEW